MMMMVFWPGLVCPDRAPGGGVMVLVERKVSAENEMRGGDGGCREKKQKSLEAVRKCTTSSRTKNNTKASSRRREQSECERGMCLAPIRTNRRPSRPLTTIAALKILHPSPSPEPELGLRYFRTTNGQASRRTRSCGQQPSLLDHRRRLHLYLHLWLEVSWKTGAACPSTW